jgi:hypothetical protein
MHESKPVRKLYSTVWQCSYSLPVIQFNTLFPAHCSSAACAERSHYLYGSMAALMYLEAGP